MTEVLKEKKSYADWPGTVWVNESLDWKEAKIVSAGIDVGSVSSKFVIMSDGEIAGYSAFRTQKSSEYSSQYVTNALFDKMDHISLDNIHYIVATGYGRVQVPFSNKAITEIACHARGANYIYGPTIRTILDMGGQDLKIIKCDERGKVLNFVMNDKCAAGCGRAFEVLADLVRIPIEELGPMSLKVEGKVDPVSSTCVLYAKSEVMGLLREGVPKERVLAAYFEAMKNRVIELIKRVDFEPEFVITGGIAKNPGMVKRIEKELGVKVPESKVDPMIAGAVGAAIFAKTLCEKTDKKSS